MQISGLNQLRVDVTYMHEHSYNGYKDITISSIVDLTARKRHYKEQFKASENRDDYTLFKKKPLCFT